MKTPDSLLRAIAAETRVAIKGLRRSPAYASLMISTLALGIGLNVAVFVVADHALFQPGPFRTPDRLVVLKDASATDMGGRAGRTAPDIIDWQDQRSVFEDVAAYLHGAGNLESTVGVERVSVALATPDLFAVLGVRPARGRAFLPEELSPGRAPVVIVSDGIWRRDLAASPNAIGSQIRISGRTYTVVGVMPPDFRFPNETDAWVPMTVPFDMSQLGLLRVAMFETVIARLQSGADVRTAQSVADRLVHDIGGATANPNQDTRVSVVPFRQELNRLRGSSSALLLATAGLLLLITVANATNLALARGKYRIGELRIRRAIGASSLRALAPVIAEPTLLAAIAGATGFVVAIWSASALAASGALSFGEFTGRSINWRIAGATTALTLGAGAAIALSCVAMLRREVAESRTNSFIAGATGFARVRRLLLVSQVALTVCLLASATLLIRSLGSLLAQDADLSPSVITAEAVPTRSQFPSAAALSDLADKLLEGARSLPGVRAAGIVSNLPLSGGVQALLPITLTGASSASTDSRDIQVDREAATPGYFAAIGLPLLSGRDFTPSDVEGAPHVAVISQDLAERYWPNGSPLGATLQESGDTQPSRIVGVVKRLNTVRLGQRPIPEVYFPYAQRPTAYFGVVIRSDASIAAVAAPLRRILASIAPGVPLFRVRTFGDVKRDSVVPETTRSMILAILGLVATVIAAIGVYGTAAYAVMQRRMEIGIRRALGARGSHIVSLALVDSVGSVLAGIVAGLLLGLAVGRSLASFLFGVSATDPTTLLLVGAGVLLLSALASLIPAWRASRVDPMIVMRNE